MATSAGAWSRIATSTTPTWPACSRRKKAFTDWIKLITTANAQWTYSEFAESWLDGANMLLRTGTTTVADIEAVPELLPEVWDATPLRVISFLEMTGVRSRRTPALIFQEALDRIEACCRAGRCRRAFAARALLHPAAHCSGSAAELPPAKHAPRSPPTSPSRPTEFEMFRHAPRRNV